MGKKKHKARCTLFLCQEWIEAKKRWRRTPEGKPWTPVLRKDKETGFWLCPNCHASYGVDAQSDEWVDQDAVP